jgi:NTE family protein
MNKIKLLFVTISLLMCGMVCAQGQQVGDGMSGVDRYQNRKKVGVVLSGGGAKGMAHIGVLKVLERAGIPVDVITGTSMGSIIGGLYAIGYNANSLDSMVRVQDWSYVITDMEDLRNQSLSDRKKRYTYALSRGLTFGKRNNTDGGIITGKNLYELFQQLCTGYTDSLDFSRDLPIPFACVATNIIDNTEVDFHSGRLPQAMRASMAIPAAFSPVRIGDMVLVDGGLRNNYPVDIAREMGADIIIGVTVQGAPKTAEDLKGTGSILGQIVDVNCKNKYDENLAITDVPIRVDTKGYNAASFSLVAIDTLIRRGEEEAMRHWDEIIALKQRIGIDDSFHPTILHPLRPKVMTEKQHVTDYVFENMTPQDERFLRQKFHLRKTDSIDANLEQQLTTSMRVDLFYQTAECHLQPADDGVRVVLTAGNRKSSQVYVGMRYDTEEHASVQLSADFPLRAGIPMNADVTLRLGKRVMAHGDWTFHPRSFTRPTLAYTYRRNDLDVFIDGDRDYSILYNQHQTELVPINLDIRHFNLRMGLRWDYLNYRDKLVSSMTNDVNLENDHYFSYRARLDYNSEDNWIFPTRGARFKAEYAYLTDNFAQLDKKPGMSDVNANWRMSITFGKRFTLQPMLYGRLLFGTVVPLVFGNTIGGEWFGHYIEQQMPFAGIGNMEYVGNQFAAFQLQAQQRVGDNHYFLLRAAVAQHSAQLEDLFKEKTLLGFQAAYYYNTMFGPLGVTIGYSNRTKKPHLFINLGYEF